MRIDESSNARMGSFALASVGLLGATFIGFVSEVRTLSLPDRASKVRAAISSADGSSAPKFHARTSGGDHVK
jgi:hypothetical protein